MPDKKYSDFTEYDQGFPEIPEDIIQVLKTFDKIKNNPETYDPSLLQLLMDRCSDFANWLLYDYMKKIYESNTDRR